MNALHDVLDDWRGIPIVISSQKNLDAAKMSRCLRIMMTHSSDDLEQLVLGLLCDCNCKESLKVFHRQVSEQERRRILGLSMAFSGINSLIPKHSERGFHLRDFIYLLKNMRCSLVSKHSETLNLYQSFYFDSVTLLEGLRQNFQTFDSSNFSTVAKEFLDKCNLYDPSWNIEQDDHGNMYLPFPKEQLIVAPHVLASLTASIQQPERDPASPTTAFHRYTLLIDRSNSQSTIDLLFYLRIFDFFETKVLTMPSSGVDENIEIVSEFLLQVRIAAENGFTILLVNCNLLYSALYDLLNDGYNLVGRTKHFCNLDSGNVSRPICVHPKFKLIVHISSDELFQIPLAFLNRFNKFALSFRDVLLERVEFYKQTWNLPFCFRHESSSIFELLFKLLVESGERFADEMGGASLFYGFRRNETVPALCLKVLNDACSPNMILFRVVDHLSISRNDLQAGQHYEYSQLPFSARTPSGDLKSRIPEFIRAIYFQILQMARPECVFNMRIHLSIECKHDFFRQEHFSFISIVRHVMSLPWDGSCSFLKLIAFTRTNSAVKLLHTFKFYVLTSLFQTQSVVMMVPGQRFNFPENSIICILCLEAFPDAFQVQVAIREFFEKCTGPKVLTGKGKECSKALLLSIDMNIHSASFVSFLRREIDKGMESLRTTVSVKYRMPSVFFILHIETMCLNFRACYDSFATNNWSFVYTDSFGVETSDVDEQKARSQIDLRKWLQIAFGLTKQSAVDMVRSDLSERFSTLTREALEKLHFFQQYLMKKGIHNGVQKSLPAYKERNSARAAAWICDEVFMKRPYLERALLDNYALNLCSLLESTLGSACSQICNGQSVSVVKSCIHCKIDVR